MTSKADQAIQKIGKQVDNAQLLYVMEKVKNWVHFVGMDETQLAQVAGIILVAGEEYKNQGVQKKSKTINLFDPATYQ
jgi:hypothetical protein